MSAQSRVIATIPITAQSQNRPTVLRYRKLTETLHPTLWSDLIESDQIRKLLLRNRLRSFVITFDQFRSDSQTIDSKHQEVLMKTERRSRAITAHVTQKELDRITQQANTTNRSVSEWLRQLLLNAVSQSTADFNTQVLLSETAATRASMMMLMQHAINGTKVTEDDVVSILEECDQARFTMAAGRLRDALKVLGPSMRKGAAQ